MPSERYPTFGLNRFNWRSVDEFVADVKLAEDLGYGYALSPSNPLAIRDPYVMLAAAARETSTIRLGLLIDNAVLSHPAVTAGSIATLDEVSDGRALLVYGVGDTAVRWLGKQPASVRKLEESTILIRRLLAGEKVEVGAERPARLFHARPAPVLDRGRGTSHSPNGWTASRLECSSASGATPTTCKPRSTRCERGLWKRVGTPMPSASVWCFT